MTINCPLGLIVYSFSVTHKSCHSELFEHTYIYTYNRILHCGGLYTLYVYSHVS